MKRDVYEQGQEKLGNRRCKDLYARLERLQSSVGFFAKGLRSLCCQGKRRKDREPPQLVNSKSPGNLPTNGRASCVVARLPREQEFWVRDGRQRPVQPLRPGVQRGNRRPPHHRAGSGQDNRQPRPRELPVTNQTCAIHPPIIRNRFLQGRQSSAQVSLSKKRYRAAIRPSRAIMKSVPA